MTEMMIKYCKISDELLYNLRLLIYDIKYKCFFI